MLEEHQALIIIWIIYCIFTVENFCSYRFVCCYHFRAMSGSRTEPDSELQKDEEEEDEEEEDALLCDEEEMDLLGEIFDTLSSRSSHDRGLLYGTRSLDLFGPDSHDFITRVRKRVHVSLTHTQVNAISDLSVFSSVFQPIQAKRACLCPSVAVAACTAGIWKQQRSYQT